MRTMAPTPQCCGGFVGSFLGISAEIRLNGISPCFGFAAATGDRGPSGNGAA
jgi:hypothetical protein